MKYIIRTLALAMGLLLTGCGAATDFTPGDSPFESSVIANQKNPFQDSVDKRNGTYVEDIETDATEGPTENNQYIFWPETPVFSLSEVYLERLKDGDTGVFIEKDSGQPITVRFTGIDTPEMNFDGGSNPEPFAIEATNFTQQLLENRTLFLEINPDHPVDKYDRILGYIWIDKEESSTLSMANAEIIKEGFATAMTIPPNTVHAQVLEKLEEEAKNAGLGIWGGK